MLKQISAALLSLIILFVPGLASAASSEEALT